MVFSWNLWLALPALMLGLSLTNASYAFRRYVLTPLHLACPVQLVHGSKDFETKCGSYTSLLSLVESKCPSLVGPRAFYMPTWYLVNGHAATIFSAVADFTKVDQIVYERQYLRVPDGGTLALDFAPTFEEAPRDNRPILLLLHGLTGGSHESYIRSVVAQAIKPKSEGGYGMRALVMNYRGCGFPSILTSPQLYHGGYTDDPRRVLLYLSQLLPDAPVVAMGFSLGANQLTKLLGEEGDKSVVKAAVSLSNPFHFFVCNVKLASTWLRRIYSRAMAKNLRTLLQRHVHMFKGDQRIHNLDWVFMNPKQTLYEFDNQVTSRLAGYENADQYYDNEASVHHVQNIRVPYLALNAHDDGIAPPDDDVIPYDAFKNNPYTMLALTQHGGHLGYYEGGLAAWTKRRWLPRPALEFVSAVLEADPLPRRSATHPTPQKIPEPGDDFVYDTVRRDIGFKLVGHDDIVMGGQASQGADLKMTMGGL